MTNLPVRVAVVICTICTAVVIAKVDATEAVVGGFKIKRVYVSLCFRLVKNVVWGIKGKQNLNLNLYKQILIYIS